jgi:hypothetical protein
MEEVTMETRLSIRKAVVVSVAAALTSVFLAAPVAAQENYGLKIYSVESGLYPYVQVYFRTFDQNEEPLVNLNYSNIGLMVKGRSYDPSKGQYGIQPLRQRPEAVRSVLVIDASKSMAGKPFEAALKAAALFIDSKRPQDQIAILAIRDTEKGYEVISTWERDAEALGRRLADIRADGMNTRLYDSIGAAMQMSAMMGQESHDPGAGRDEGSALSREELNSRISSLSVPVPIYSIAYSRISSEYFKNLEALSKNSFGVYILVGEAIDRMQQRSVERIQRILLGDYVVTFRSYLPVDGESHAFKLGVEYPSGSGRFTYQGARFEAIEPPPAQVILDQMGVLSQSIKTLPDSNPFLERGAPPPVEAGGE